MNYHRVLRLISVEAVKNYLSHTIYISIFDFLLNFLLFVRLQTPTSSKMLEGGIMVSERQVRLNVNLKHLGLTKVYRVLYSYLFSFLSYTEFSNKIYRAVQCANLFSVRRSGQKYV